MSVRPFQPLSVEEHKRRYPAALADLCDGESMMLGSAAAPDERSACVFDFHDGLRLCVTREVLRGGSRGIHISASVQPGSDVDKAANDGTMSFGAFIGLARQRFLKISAETREPLFIGLSHGERQPHWFLRENSPPQEGAATND